ncbi:MAG: hypothetical protein DLM59_20300 [Pseudonocardiales bacterium]|nr:MAG: hypothetical protein DLM59_20300 [Pseudonocardiales bacterium]
MVQLQSIPVRQDEVVPSNRSPFCAGCEDRRMTPEIRAFVAAHLDVPADRLTDRVLLGEELAVDSLAAIELAMALEEEFGIGLSEDVMAGVHTYGDLERVVIAQRGSS